MTALHTGPSSGYVGTATNGFQLGCDWNGAVWLTHGWDGNCAFFTGMSVTCSAGHITNFQFVENSQCARSRD